jgi:hypothetical protein
VRQIEKRRGKVPLPDDKPERLRRDLLESSSQARPRFFLDMTVTLHFIY